MPLLLIPHELLLDIIVHVAASAPSTARCPESLSVLKGLAHSCRLLRALAITVIYSNITVDSEVGKLGPLLVDYPHIAACVRQLKVHAPHLRVTDHDNSHLLRGILSVCCSLHELSLEKDLSWNKGTRTGFEDGLLDHLAAGSKSSLQTIRLEGLGLESLLGQFKHMLHGGFTSLTTIFMPSCHVYNPYDVQRDRTLQTHIMSSLIASASTNTTWPPKTLTTVRTFTIDARFPYRLVDEPGIGVYFTKTLPELKVLHMTTSPSFIYGSLWAYTELGSQITELTLTASYPSSSSHRRENPQMLVPQRNHFCDIVVMLAPKLTKFILRGNSELRICHKLFSTSSSWPQLSFLNIVCACGCEGIKPTILRSGLTKITDARPHAYIYIEGNVGEDLVNWNTKSLFGVPLKNSFGISLEENFIAPLEMFEKLGPRIFWNTDIAAEVEEQEALYAGGEIMDIGFEEEVFLSGLPDDTEDKWVGE